MDSALSKLRKRLCFSGETRAPSLPGELCRRFSLDEIKTATHNFNKELILSGRVYKGFIDEEGNSRPVAIKRLNRSLGRQDAEEFRTEILLLSQIRHVHLIPFIGFCSTDKGEMILVYDFMANKTLYDHLYDTDKVPLHWKQRLKICIGVALGLHYLHTGLKHQIIHGDVKATNIFLDKKCVAKVSGFELSQQVLNDIKFSSNFEVEGMRGPLNFVLSGQILKNTQFSNLAVDLDKDGIRVPMKGTYGYIDPDFLLSSRLTEKSDVYSFGVVLFEVLCAQKPFCRPQEEDGKWLLSHRALECMQRGTIGEIIDPHLIGKITPECFNVYVEVAASCVHCPGIQRPRMVDVIEKLELALELQENADAQRAMCPGSENRYPMVPSFPLDAATAASVKSSFG